MDITDIDRSPELVVYRLAKGALLEFKRVHFPINTHVIVNCPGRRSEEHTSELQSH